MKTICITCKNDCNNAGTTARISWCPQYKPGRILSNADRIRTMGDADLARWLEYEGGGACAEVYGWLAWLQQPAEEGNLEEAIEKYLKIKEGGQHGQAENLRGAWG